MAQTLTDEGRAALADAGWTSVDGRDAVQKQFKFANFVDAFGWMTQVALVSEKLNHHPEWTNVYIRVDVVLTTHSLDGLSDLDLKLAQRMDKMAAH